jgi:polyhydroxybutyrate depolymerase
MKSNYLFVALLINSLFSFAQIIDETFEFEGATRMHKVYLPANFSDNSPLVLNLHGYTSNAFQQVFYTNMNAVAEENDFVVVFPDGTTDQYGITFWNSEILGESVNDLGYLEALIDSMILNYNIDPNRVYMCGMSNGGFMSYYSACELSDRIAAIASVTGTMNNAILDNCNPERAVPVLEIHGTADGTVPYNGASSTGSFQTMMPIEEVVDFWVNHNNCMLESELELEDISTSDMSTVTHFKYTGRDNGSSVEHYRINEGGHTWPGSIIPLPSTNHDIIASEVIWDFFKQYTLNGMLTVHEGVEEASFTMSPNPMSEFTILKCSSKIQTLTIYNLQGKVLFNKAINDFEYTLEKGLLGSGMYIIELVADGSRICQPLLVQ